jgi:hypothetical protein
LVAKASGAAAGVIGLVAGVAAGGSGQANAGAAAGGGAFGTLAQAATAHAITARPVRRARIRGERRMLWLALEIGLGLALFIGIVWWTFPRAPRHPPKQPPQDGR